MHMWCVYVCGVCLFYMYIVDVCMYVRMRCYVLSVRILCMCVGVFVIYGMYA